MPARSEPLLWVQLIGAGLFPLEGLLLLLLLAGSDPGPLPGLERLLCWALGALAPTLLLWRRPADVWSLLLLQAPLRARRPLQQRLSRLQDNLGLRLGLALAALISLPLLGWLDEHAAVASSLSPLSSSPRLVVLLLAAVLLAVMLWQWQQLLQALWLLTRSPETVASAEPMSQAELEQRRLCLGLPLLLLEPLQLAVPPAGSASGAAAAVPQPPTPTPTAAAAESEEDAAVEPAFPEHQPEAAEVVVADELIEISTDPEEPVPVSATDAESSMERTMDPRLAAESPAEGQGEDSPSGAGIPAELPQEASPGDDPGSASEPELHPQAAPCAVASGGTADSPGASELPEAAVAKESPGAPELPLSGAGGEAATSEAATPEAAKPEGTD